MTDSGEWTVHLVRAVPAAFTLQCGGLLFVSAIPDQASNQDLQDCFGLPSKIWVISQMDIGLFDDIRKERVISQQGTELAE
jgi:hypothetical protein